MTTVCQRRLDTNLAIHFRPVRVGWVANGALTIEQPLDEYTWTEHFYAELDPEIEPVVRLLNQRGVLTLESCQGGAGHGYGYPTVLFSGDRDMATSVRELVRERRRKPLFSRGDPIWELTLHHPEHRKLSISKRIVRMIKLAIGL